MYLCLVGSIVLYTLCEVIAILILTIDGTAKVVATIYDITYPGEAILVATAIDGLTTYIHLRMSENVGIAGTTEGVIDASVAKVYKGVTAYQTFVTATIEIFGFCQILYNAVLRIYRLCTVKVYRCTISRVERITVVTLTINNRSAICVVVSLTHDTQFGTSEYL